MMLDRQTVKSAEKAVCMFSRLTVVVIATEYAVSSKTQMKIMNRIVFC